MFCQKSATLLGMVLAFICFPVISFSGNGAGAAFSVWPDTGQISCRDYAGTLLFPCPTKGKPFYGQDAQYNGMARSYTILGNGIMVRDNVTGLIWERKQNTDISDPHNAGNKYAWCDTDPSTNSGVQGDCTNEYSLYNTKDFINSLNNASFGGYSNWRLPTIKELLTLVNYSSNSIVDDIYFPNHNDSCGYWSSTTKASNTDRAWYVTGGSMGSYPKSWQYSPRCVRAVRNTL